MKSVRKFKLVFFIAMLISLLPLAEGFADSLPQEPNWPQHSNSTWQELVSITWSVDGVAWNNNAVSVGQTVYFKFEIDKEELGNHYADFLKSWIDWNNDGFFEESETIAYYKNLVQGIYKPSNDQGGEAAGTPFTVTTSGILMTDADIGSHWLLARVTCSESILASNSYGDTWNNQWKWWAKRSYEELFTSNLDYWQGNLMTSVFTVNTAVPEPATTLLFGIGSIGLAGVMRRKIK